MGEEEKKRAGRCEMFASAFVSDLMLAYAFRFLGLAIINVLAASRLKVQASRVACGDVCIWVTEIDARLWFTASGPRRRVVCESQAEACRRQAVARRHSTRREELAARARRLRDVAERLAAKWSIDAQNSSIARAALPLAYTARPPGKSRRYDAAERDSRKMRSKKKRKRQRAVSSSQPSSPKQWVGAYWQPAADWFCVSLPIAECVYFVRVQICKKALSFSLLRDIASAEAAASRRAQAEPSEGV